MIEMADPSIPEIMFTTTSLLFLLIGVVLLVSIIMATFNPYDQIAFANTEKLRAKMDQACLNNQDDPVATTAKLEAQVRELEREGAAALEKERRTTKPGNV